MPIPPLQTLVAVRGDDWAYQATFVLGSGSITSCKLWMTIKRYATQSDAEAAIQVSTDSGGVLIDDGTHATFVLTAAQTEALQTKNYVFDVAVLTPEGKTYTALRGTFKVIADVTRTRN